MTEDHELLRRYVESGEQEGFTEFVRRHLSLVYFAAVRGTGGNTTLAEDVTQQVFTSAARSAPTLLRHATVTGWLYTATRYTSAKAIRTERSRLRQRQELSSMHALLANEPAREWERLQPVIDDALEELGRKDREAVLLRFFESRAFAEIGAALGVSEDAARMRVERALDKLRGRLGAKGLTSTSAALALALANQGLWATPGALVTAVSSAALTGAAAAGTMGIAACLMTLMSPTKLTTGALALALIMGAFGTAVHGTRMARATDLAQKVAEADYTALLALRRATEQRFRDADQESTHLRQSLAEAKVAESTATNSSAASEVKALPATVSAWDPVAEGKAFMGRHPELKSLSAARADAMNRFSYGPLIRELGLTPEKTEEFLAFLREGEGITGAFGPGGKSLFLSAGEGSTETDVDGRLKAILGKEGVRKYAEFFAVQLARSTTVRLTSELMFTETPLSTEQTDRLIRIMTETQPSDPSGNPRRLDWTSIESAAPNVLSPPQLAALVRLRKQERGQHPVTTLAK